MNLEESSLSTSEKITLPFQNTLCVRSRQ